GQLVLRDIEALRVVLAILPVLLTEEAESDDLPAPFREHVADRHEVAEGLRHLLGFQGEESVVHPVSRPVRPVHRLADHRLALVVRELEVLPASMDVDLWPEVLRGHREALDVPPGPPLPPRALPRGLVRPRSLPDSEVERVLLLAVRRELVGDDVVELLVREDPERTVR